MYHWSTSLNGTKITIQYWPFGLKPSSILDQATTVDHYQVLVIKPNYVTMFWLFSFMLLCFLFLPSSPKVS